MSKKIRKRKFNFKKFISFILILSVIILLYIYLSRIPIKHILVVNTNFLTDEEIIETAKLESYPSFIKTLSFKVKKDIKSIPLVKDVKVSKGLGFKITLDIDEYKVLFKIRSTNEYVLDSNTRVEDLSINAPILINYVPDDTLDKLIDKFLTLDQDIILKISEIEYSPNIYDKERFIFYMNDDNVVYVTLTKLKEFNSYNKIKEQLGVHKGILYLDSGNYFEIKDE